LVGNSTVQIAPTTTARMTMTCSPIETGSVKIRWIPTLCFFDSTTVVSNMALIPRSALLGAGRRFLLLDDLDGPVADLVRVLDVFLRLERISFRERLLAPQKVEVSHRLEVIGLHVDGVLQRVLPLLDDVALLVRIGGRVLGHLLVADHAEDVERLGIF